MSHPSIAELLHDIDHLPYPRRMALLATRAREFDAAALDGVLAGLRAGDEFEREVGLFLAEAAGHADEVRAYLDDPDARIVELALRYLVRKRLLDAATLTEKLVDASAVGRRAIYRELRAATATDLADALVDRVRAEFGDGEAVRLLPACGPATLARLLPELGHAAGDWAAIAKRHPQVVLAEAARQLADLTDVGRGLWWGRHGNGVLAAAPKDPSGVLDLLERFAPATDLPGQLEAYGVLAVAAPARVLALLTAPGRAGWLERAWLPAGVLRRVGRLEPAMLVGLARALRDDDYRLAALLETMPPSRRAALFDAAFADVAIEALQLGQDLLDALPRPVRIAQAERMLRLAAVRDSEELVLLYTAYLDWPQAQSALAAAVARGEAEERAQAWELVVECAARSGTPGALTEAIAMMRRLRNEQDPVRSRALLALVTVPGWRLEPEAAEALSEVVTHAMQARDVSPGTARAVVGLAVTALHRTAEAPALLEFARLALRLAFGAGQPPSLPPLNTELRRGQEVELFAAVRPALQDDIDHGRFGSVLELASALGRRAWALPDLQSMLEQTVRRANVASTVARAIDLWLADPAERSTRVAEVLQFDSSTAVLRRVWATIEARRTDLLDQLLSGPGPAGRFLASDRRWVPDAAGHSRRWLPRQRQAYVELLARIAADDGIPSHSRAAAIAAAARAGAAGAEVVRGYLDSADVTLAEAALAALVWTDRPAQSLALLLTYVDTDRARVAVYAAGRAASFVPPSQARELLEPIATGIGKITSRKEALRLIARFGGRGSGAVLRAAWLAPDQHRDVRAAVVSTARQRLDERESWLILHEAASGGRYDVRALVGAAPLSVPAVDRTRYAELVVSACEHEDHEAARDAWAALARWTPWAPDLTGLLVGQLSDLDDRSLWTFASQSLVSLVGQGTGESPLAASVRALLTLDGADPTRDDPEVDRPAYRRLESLVESLVSWARRGNAGPGRPALTTAARLLAAEPDWRPPGARLLVQALVLDDPLTLDGELDVLHALLTEPVAVGAVAEVGRDLARRLASLRPVDPGHLRTAAERLAGRGDVASGLLALAVAQYGGELGWPEEWRAIVHGLRRHESADVRLAALRVVTVAD